MAVVDDFLSKLEGVRRAGDGWRARCPAHDDRLPSLSVKAGQDGRVLVRCHAGCDFASIVESVGMAPADLFEPDPSVTYAVRDRAGVVLAFHNRTDQPDGGKSVRWQLPDGTPSLDGHRLADMPLYLAHALPADLAVPVVVTEGEKAAEALRSVDVAAVGTVTGAAVTPSAEALDVLRGRHVVLWPDADDAGRKHMAAIAERLTGVAASVRVATWPDAPEKGDAADYVVRRLDPWDVLDAAVAPAPAPRRLIAVRAIDTTPPQFLVPPVLSDDDGLHILFGDGGAGKTSLAAGVVTTLAAPAPTVSGLLRVGNARPAILLPYEAPRGLARRVVGLLGSQDAPIFLAPDDVMVRPLWEGIPLAADIARVELADHGGSDAAILVDSISFGLAGQSTSADEPPTLTAAAVARARMPVLATAHQNRAGDDSKPFGSAFWHNAARMTWHAKLEAGLFVLTCRKANDHDMEGERRAYRPDWADEGILAGLTAVFVKVDTSERLRDALLAAGRALTVAELVAASSTAFDTVEKALKRHPDVFVRTGGKGAPWALRVSK